MAALTVEFPQTVWTVEFGGDEIVVAPVTMAPGAPGGGGAVDSVNGQTGVVVLDAGDVGADPAGTAAGLVDDLSGVTNAATARTNLGLGNVDNTSDANKPVSTAQQTALDGKAAASHSHSGADITSGTVSTARLGTGTASASTYLRGDQTWAAVTPGASAINDLTDVDTATDPPATDDVLAWDGTLWTPAALTAADTGAIPASLIDAKGDLIVGAAADTAARLAVGANGTSPIADSGSATGLLWGRSLAAPVPYKTGLWYSSPRNAVGTYSFAGGYIRMHPFVPHSTLTIDRIACYVTATTGGKARLGIYRGDGADGYAGSLVVDAGEVDTATTGDKIATCSATLQAGALYWFAANNNVATAFAHWGGYGADAYAAIHAWGSTAPISGPSSFLTCYMAYSYGPLPSTATPTPWNIGPPYLIVRAA